MRFKVFIQSQAGSNQKHYHDEKRLEWKRTVELPRPYPFPYGFVIGTTGADGCNLDCFVITDQLLRTGQVVECEAIGLMEQIEDGEDDHKVLARLCGEKVEIDTNVQRVLTEFVYRVFEHIEGKQVRVGRFLGRDEAAAHIVACGDDT